MSSAPLPPPVFVLDLHPSGQRLRSLLVERDRLMQRIAKKRLDVAAARERARRSTEDVFLRVEPLRERLGAVRADIRGLFDELAATEALSRRARQLIAGVRRQLEIDGVIDADGVGPDEDDDFGGLGLDGAGPEQVVAGANPRARAKGHETTRTLFRRLSLAVHPDHARDDDDRMRRTDVMKAVTQAYEQGDLARLFEIEATCVRPGEHDANADASNADDRRCDEIERGNRALKRQSKALDRELRELRAVESGTPPSSAMDALLPEVEREVAELEKMRDFVASFRDGKISLEEFLDGPRAENPYEGDHDLEDVALEGLLLALADVLGDAAPAPAPRRAGKSTKRKRRTRRSR